MYDLGILIGLTTLLVAIIALWIDHRRNKKNIKTMAEMIILYRKEIELLQGSLPAQIALQKEWIELQTKIHEAEERRYVRK